MSYHRIYIQICAILLPLLTFSISGRCNTNADIDSSFLSLPASQFAVEEDGSLPRLRMQFNTGAVTANGAHIDYPVYAPLTSEEIRRIRRAKIQLPETIQIDYEYGMSRKQNLLEINLLPFVNVNGQMMRLTSCRILPILHRVRSTKAATPNRATERWPSNSVLSEGKWVKISVKEEGIYRLTPEMLRKAGFSNPEQVKLYGYGGRIIPEAWSFDGLEALPGDLEEVPLRRLENGTALFFAEGIVRYTWNAKTNRWAHENNPYSTASYYFLTEGSNPATMSLSDPVLPNNAPIISEIVHYTVTDVDASAIYSGGRELYDSHNFANSPRRTLKIELPDLVAGTTPNVSIAMAAANINSPTPVSLSANGKEIYSFSIPAFGSDQSGYESRRIFSTQDLIEGTNTLTIETKAAGVKAYLNYFAVNYVRKLNAANSPYVFYPNRQGVACLTIENAANSTEVWQIGRMGLPASICPSSLSATTLSATIPDGEERYIIADIQKTYPTPTIIGEIATQNLHADEAADMIIVVPEGGKLTAEAERLAEAHRNISGIRVRVVDMGSIYNEFSSGTPDASALRRYMKMLYDRAESEQDMPRYLLLFGACAWDNRMLTTDWSGRNIKDYLPAFEVNNGASRTSNVNFSLGEIDSYITDDFYGWLDDTEGTAYSSNKLDVAIGRIPAESAEEAKIMVDKTIAYLNNEQRGAWKNKVYVLGDDMNNTLHMKGAEAIATATDEATNGLVQVNKVYWDTELRTNSATGYSYPKTAQKLQEAMTRGALFFNYTGHGSPEQISHARVLVKEDFSRSSAGRFPLWVMASCEISPYDTRGTDIGRIALFNPTGGAFAVMCASRSVYANYNEALNKYFTKQLFECDKNGRPISVGEALQRCKVQLLTAGGDATFNKLKYALLGDPAVPIAAPRNNVYIDSINGIFMASGLPMQQLKAGSVVRFSGHVANAKGAIDNEFEGTITASLFDRIETITCKNNSKDDQTMTYQDRTKLLFEGTDSIRGGRFEISIPIPRDISYSEENGCLSLYASGKGRDAEAHGSFKRFYLNGTDANAPADTIAPNLFLYLNSPDFPNGGIVPQEALLIADIADDCAINASGVSLGHNIELCIDNKTNEIISLNDYFSYDFGSYRTGQVTYTMPQLDRGEHQLTLRVWDVAGNATTQSLNFTIGDAPADGFSLNITKPVAKTTTNIIIHNSNNNLPTNYTIEAYDLNGRCVWLHRSTSESKSHYLYSWNLTDINGSRLPAGIYLLKAKAESDGLKQETKAQRIIVLQP